MKIIILTSSILAVLFGAFMVVYGGYDDSPGGQLLGIVLVAAGIFGFVKGLKRKSINHR